MSQSTMFVDADKRAAVERWCARFREKLSVATEDRAIPTSFGRTHALVTGPADAPPLVVLHGALASSAHILPELGSLTSTRRVYAIDVLGQSAWSEDRRLDVGDDSYGRWLVEVCDGLGLDHYDLFGVSWGGFVALRAAKTAPERVSHLVLMVPAGVVANGAWAGFRDAGWPLLTYRMFPSEARLERLMRALFSNVDPDWMAYFGDALQAYRFDMRIPPLAKEGELSAIRCPTLVFGAEDDASFPGRALLSRIRELVPHAEVELIEGAKHCPPLTEEFRERTATRVERFLSAS